MVVADMKPSKIKKPILKVSMSDSDPESSSTEESDGSEYEEPAKDVLRGEADDDTNEESDSSSDANDQSVLVANEGWADSVAKILGSNKPKSKKTLVLSRAKKHSEIIKKDTEEKPAFEVIGESKVKAEVKTEETTEPPVKRVKQEKPTIRLKPNVLEKDRERLLSKIATKGVVQLFNAVRNQQKSLQQDSDRTDISEGKKEKLLKKFDKRAFLDTLMGQSKSIVVDKETNKLKDEEIKDEDKPRWNALRDDFMMGAKMKDWDKESVDE